MVLAGAVAGSITAAATAVGAAGTLNGNFGSFLPEPVVCIMIPKTNSRERNFLEAWYILPALVTVRYCS